ncbi:MAG: hypothetical protein JW741_20615 [Sedimentisphaerales bacterium]|nr:hypothetical protein [Sedimentisphaerales bacterium]
MPLMEVDWHPSARQLRIFGLSAPVASAILAAVLVFLWGATAVWAIALLAAGAGILLCSLIWPSAARIVYLVLTLTALPIGYAISFVLLAAFYFLLLTPLGLVFRLIRRDALHRNLDRSCSSYWIPRRPPATMDRYFHQF